MQGSKIVTALTFIVRLSEGSLSVSAETDGLRVIGCKSVAHLLSERSNDVTAS